MLLWLFLSILIFVVIEVFIHIFFQRKRKFSEVLSIVLFLFCSWMVTEKNSAFIYLGVVFFILAICLDLYRRKKSINNL